MHRSLTEKELARCEENKVIAEYPPNNSSNMLTISISSTKKVAARCENNKVTASTLDNSADATTKTTNNGPVALDKEMINHLNKSAHQQVMTLASFQDRKKYTYVIDKVPSEGIVWGITGQIRSFWFFDKAGATSERASITVVPFLVDEAAIAHKILLA
ncbi:hypothetical protein SERLADRAFT_404472 [Serpula lacrymans var. lacrymans S7.9]|uniref:Uncharacterized protein n=1 Tax=Serpula lacrymans var. lacrymans (strain S7.9) TaxID=578457 RepID=F8ND98_SERL9|nr:uncharacterized protein SERLADRAFT_404472 [Serpula lacrymans var. lacrymans S7.9]EGO30182.1 hypothetical protein SERLADRAFT_404472 [Serpula lacrymans var. lacrymans S7.9]